MIAERYSRNLPAITPAEQRLLGQKRVLVAGCGGLGGYVIENLVRLGVGEITAVVGDVFQPSNLNRQLLCTVPRLGRSKARAAAERARDVNPNVVFRAVESFLDASNADELTAGQDLVMDALDNVPARLLLERACEHAGVTLIHGAIHGWCAQVAVVPPGSGLLGRLYAGGEGNGENTTLPFTPAFCAAIQCAQAVKLLCGLPSELEGKVMVADLLGGDWQMLTL